MAKDVVAITVEHARDLSDADFFGKQDPYVLVSCGGQEIRSKTASGGGTNPVWNQTFTFTGTDADEARLVFKDEDLLDDDYLGTCTVSLAQAREAGSDSVRAPVYDKDGQEQGFVMCSIAWEKGEGASGLSYADDDGAERRSARASSRSASHGISGLLGGDEDDTMSIAAPSQRAPSRSQSTTSHRSAAKHSPAPDRDPSFASSAHVDRRSPSTTSRPAKQPSRQASDADLGGGYDDGNASIAFSEVESQRPSKPRSPAPSQRGASRSPSVADARGGGRKQPAPSESGLAMTADDDDGNMSIAYSEAASERPSRSPAAPSSQRAPSASGLSLDMSHDAGSAANTPRQHKSVSSRSHSRAGAVASQGGGGPVDNDNDYGDASLSYSAVGNDEDDAVSTRSGAPRSKPQQRPAASPSVSGLSMRSSHSEMPRTSKPAPSTKSDGHSLERPKSKAQSSRGGYSQSGFEDEDDDGIAVDHGSDEENDRRTPRGEASVSMSASISGAISMAASAKAPAARSGKGGGGGGSGKPSSRPQTASGGRSSGGDRGGGSSSGVGYSADGFEDGAGTPTSAPAGRSSSRASGVRRGDETPTSRKSGTPVFQRLPADAPDDPAPPTVQRPSSSRNAPARSSHASEGGDADGGWNEGAVRVSPPGASRPWSARRDRPRSSGSNPGDGGGYAGAGGGGGRQRPMSAAPRDRQSAQLQAMARKHPATWDPLDVANWVEFLGLGQYRRRFTHHSVDGRLLLRLTDAQLKSDMGIGPMGHRAAILDAASQLVKQYEEGQRDRMRAGDYDDGEEGGGRSGSPQRMRPSSAVTPPSGALSRDVPRRPASASRSVIPPDPFLGPAQGKQTVYEQRARLLFELDRAQARAEQHRALAEQLQHNAALSADEVAHIRGLLTDIERKNRHAFGLTNGIDSQARIPWRHVGNGTKHTNWNAERYGRPGDPDTVDLTFQPRINAESKRILGEGRGEGGATNSFLDRLDNDLRKRQGNKKELERKYYSTDAASGPGATQLQERRDWAVVAEQLQGRCQISLSDAAAEYEEQIDEALDKLSTGESWREAQLHDGPIRAAKGAAKLAAMAGALKSLAFLERYRSDLKTKQQRAKALEKKWINQTLGAQYLPGAKEKEDITQAVQFFALLGWREDEQPSEDAVTDELLDRLVERSMEFRSRFDTWWERVRDKPEERAAGFNPDIDWARDPRWAADGLAHRMEAEMRRMGGAMDDPAASINRSPSEGSGGGGGAPMDFVEFTVRLLGKCRMDDLRRMAQLSGRPKRLAVYRAIRTQKFIEFTEKDLEERDRKLRQAYEALAPKKRVLGRSRIEGFFDRLMDDASKRRAKAEKLAHDKVAKEQEILGSSVLYSRPRSGR